MDHATRVGGSTRSVRWIESLGLVFCGFFWSLVRPLADFGLVVIATFVVPLD